MESYFFRAFRSGRFILILATMFIGIPQTQPCHLVLDVQLRVLQKLQETLKPSDPKGLLQLENLLMNVSRVVSDENQVIQDSRSGHLFIEVTQVSLDHYNTSIQLGPTNVNLTLQPNGANRLVASAYAFSLNVTEQAQDEPVEPSSLMMKKYIATEDTTFLVIDGWNADSFKSSSGNAWGGAKRLSGTISFEVPPMSLGPGCMVIEKANKNAKGSLSSGKLDPVCVFFDRNTLKYSNEGCTSAVDAKGKISCKCNHLTIFTVLLAATTVILPMGVKITAYATEIVSILTLVVTIVILRWAGGDRDRVKVQINLSVALLLLHTFNVAHDLAVIDEISCMMLAVINHYLLLSTGMWFLVEGTRLLMATSFPYFFQTQDAGNRYKIFVLIGWVLPLLIVGMAAGVGFSQGLYMKVQPLYEQCQTVLNQTSLISKYDRCWMAPGTPILYASNIAPLSLALLVNFFIVLKTTRVMYHSRKMRNRGEAPDEEDALKAAKSFFVLFYMLGGTWAFGFFIGIGNEISNEVLMYIHTVVNGSQGIVVFLLYCILDEDIRQAITQCC